MESELDEKKRSLRSKRIEQRYYASLATFVLVGFVLLGFFVWAKANDAINKLQADNERTRQLICGVVAAIPEFPKTSECKKVEERRNPKPPTQASNPPKTIAFARPSPTVSEVTVTKVMQSPKPIVVITPEPVVEIPIVKEVETRIDSITKAVQCRLIGDLTWQVGNCQ